MAKKHINEHYFDEESRAMYYVVGASYSRDVLLEPSQGFRFISTHKDLVEIVRRELESEHKIILDPRGKPSYRLEVDDVPHMYSRLEELGLAVPKNQRGFPENIPEEYIRHFTRGFTDAQGRVFTHLGGKLTVISISFNLLFLKGLHKALQEYAGVERGNPSRNNIVYSHKDSLRIHNFIYGEWEFIEEHGLYLPSKKEIFTLDYSGDRSISVSRVKLE